MSFLSNIFYRKKELRESSDYFFHFTGKIDNLINILNYGFMPFYCMESLNFLNIPDSDKKMAFPVVCFCDIPLERHNNHRRKYGDYGIGLKKDWGLNEKNHLTPIVYSNENSVTSASLSNLFDLYNPILEKLPSDFHKYNNSISVLLMHFKSYEGYSYDKLKGGFSSVKERFYEEREWRYIPLNCDGLKLSLTMDDYITNRDEENVKIQKLNKLEFALDDVEFIFLKNRHEKKSFLDKLSSTYTAKQLRIINKKIHY